MQTDDVSPQENLPWSFPTGARFAHAQTRSCPPFSCSPAPLTLSPSSSEFRWAPCMPWLQDQTQSRPLLHRPLSSQSAIHRHRRCPHCAQDRCNKHHPRRSRNRSITKGDSKQYEQSPRIPAAARAYRHHGAEEPHRHGAHGRELWRPRRHLRRARPGLLRSTRQGRHRPRHHGYGRHLLAHRYQRTPSVGHLQRPLHSGPGRSHAPCARAWRQGGIQINHSGKVAANDRSHGREMWCPRFRPMRPYPRP